MTLQGGPALRFGPSARIWLARGFLLATLVWMLMLVSVPLLLARETGGRAVVMASAGTYLVGGAVCHQRPDRSFRLGGVQMSVCARCAGLYLGAVVGAVLAGVGVGSSNRRGSVRATGALLRVMVLAAALPTGATWLGEAVGWLPFAGEVRAAAAVPLGGVVAWVASLVIRGDLA